MAGFPHLWWVTHKLRHHLVAGSGQGHARRRLTRYCFGGEQIITRWGYPQGLCIYVCPYIIIAKISLALSRWPMFNDSWLGKEASTESFRRPLLTFCSMTDKRQSRRTQCNSTSRDILPRWTSKFEGPVALCHCIFLSLLRLRWPNNKMRSYTFTNTIDLNNNNVSFAFLPDLLIYFNVAFWDHQLITHQSFFLHLWP